MSKLRLIGLIAAALVLALVLQGQEGSPQSINLPGVDAKDLTCFHIKLVVPDGASKVSAEEASKTAKAADAFALPVQHMALARLLQDSPEGLLRDNLVWVVVSGDGSAREIGMSQGALGGEAPAKSYSSTYALAFVDAITGELIFGQYGPPPPEYTCP